MFAYGARDDFTVPAALQRELESKGECAEVTNLGQVGYQSTQETLCLEFALLRNDRPDIAIFYDGWNDAKSALENRAPGVPFDQRYRAREFNLTSPFLLRNRIRLYEAAVFSLADYSGSGLAAKRILKAIAPRSFWEWKGQLVRVGKCQSDDTKLAYDVVVAYLRNVAFIKTIARETGARCVFY